MKRIVAMMLVVLMVGTVLVGLTGCGESTGDVSNNNHHLYRDKIVQCVLPYGWEGDIENDVTSLMNENSLQEGIVVSIVKDVIDEEADLEFVASVYAVMQAENAGLDWNDLSQSTGINFGSKYFVKYKIDSFKNGTHFYNTWLYSQNEKDLCAVNILSKSNRLSNDVKSIMKSIVFRD